MARQVRHVLDDPLLRFWFRFVYPNSRFIAQAGAARALHERVRPELDSCFGSCFERLLSRGLARPLCPRGRDRCLRGRRVLAQGHADLVGIRADGWIDLGECKWGQVRSAAQVVRELEAKVLRFPNRRNATIGRRIFSRHKMPAKALRSGQAAWHSLDDLYETT
jgi:hypothetical protein